MTPEISIGIPTYCGAENGEHDLLWWVLSAVRLRTQSEIPYDLVVVDDSGKPAHQAKSRAVCEHFGARLFCHPENRGVAAGWNTLTRSSDAPFVALLNDDFYVSPGWLDSLVYFLRENPEAGSAGLFAWFISAEDVPWLLDAPDAKVVPRHHATKQPMPEEEQKHTGREQPGRSMAPPGCGFGFRREIYDRVGGFDESLGKCFYEESMFGSQCAALGLPAYTLQHPCCYTIMSATFGRSPELRHGNVFVGPRRKYVDKWAKRIPEIAAELYLDLSCGGGGTYPVHKRLMSKIPFRRVKWLDPDGLREEIITGEEGFHEGGAL